MPAERIFYRGDCIGYNAQGYNFIMESYLSHQTEIEGSIQQAALLGYTKEIKMKSQFALGVPRQANGIDMCARDQKVRADSPLYSSLYHETCESAGKSSCRQNGHQSSKERVRERMNG
jgi:hypothetical protein